MTRGQQNNLAVFDVSCHLSPVYKDSIVFTSVPYKRKKVRNFFRHFCTEILQIPVFFLLPKIVDSHGSWRLALVCRRNCEEKLQNTDEGPFFF